MDSDSPVEAVPATACAPWSSQPPHDFKMYQIGILFLQIVVLFATNAATLLVVSLIVLPKGRTLIKAAVVAVCDQPLMACPIVDAAIEDDTDEGIVIGGRHLDLAIKFHVRLPVFEPTLEPSDDDCDGEDDECTGLVDGDFRPMTVTSWTCPAHDVPLRGTSGIKPIRYDLFDYVRWNSVSRIMNPTHVPP